MIKLKGKFLPVNYLKGRAYTVPSGGSVDVQVEAPVFDLAAMGLPALPLTGGSSSLETDAAAICEALNKGAVTFVIPVETSGVTMQASITMVGAMMGAAYQCISMVNVLGYATIVVNVNSTSIIVACTPLNQAAGIPAVTAADNGKIMQVKNGAWAVGDKDSSPSSINMSGFEREGRIVETFADGSTATTVMEFDSNGKPTKITDGNGNVTVLTW